MDAPATLPEHDPDGLAYVVFTSGSTGRPKGIVTAHRGAAAYLADLSERHPPLGEVVLQMAAPSFDAFLRDLVGPLLGGARVELPNEEEARDPAALLALARERRVTGVWSAVPTMLRGWLSVAGEGPEPFGLRTLLVSGEVLRGEDVRRARALFGPELGVVNQYGPTECTLTTTYHAVPPASPGTEPGATPVPVGRPVAGRSVYLLDGHLEPVPPGAAGEICISGPGLARGYLRAPGATAATFVPDPFAGAGSRLYRTGDLGRLGGAGALEFIRRLDAQVKIRGHRVELGEVESHLAAHPDLVEAAVAVRDEGPGGPVLWAYPVLKPGRALDAAAVRSYLAERLPEASMPAAFVVLDRLPRNPAGKLDRNALPSSDGSRMTAAGAHQPPETPMERSLAGLWSQLLGLEEVGVRDSFFHLGGHSLLAAQMIARVQEEVGLEVSLRRFWDQPTILGLIAEIDALRSGSAVDGDGPEAGAEATRSAPIRKRSRGGRGFEDLRAQVESEALGAEIGDVGADG